MQEELILMQERRPSFCGLAHGFAVELNATLRIQEREERRGRSIGVGRA